MLSRSSLFLVALIFGVGCQPEAAEMTEPPPPVGKVDGVAGDLVGPGDPDNPPPMGKGLPQCAAYEDMPDTYGYCLYKFAGGFPSISEVERLCPLAGDWESECRHAWVAGRQNADSGFTTETLLGVCGGNPDCTFELLDFRPAEDVLEQLALCGKHAGKHAPDCAGHAMQRWWLAEPDAEEHARVTAAATRYPDKVGYYVGVDVICSGVGDCSGNNAVEKQCLKTVEHFERNPGTCPPRQKAVLNPDQNRGRSVPGPGAAPGQGGKSGQPGQQPQGQRQPRPQHQGAPQGPPRGGQAGRPPNRQPSGQPAGGTVAPATGG